MVKADGYGLGALRVMAALEPLRPWGAGVATCGEGIALREARHGGRIVVFAPCVATEAEDLVAAGLEPAVTSLDALEALGRAAAASGGETLPVHLEIDTGMGRSGLPHEAAAVWGPALGAALGRFPLRVESTFTHLHSAEDDPEATRAQRQAFREALERLRECGVETALRHVANSAGILLHEVDADLARPGIALYGGGREWGSGSEPVAALRARILDVREVQAGATVGYGATYRTPAATRLATVGAGYGDGVPRALSNRGAFLVAGRRAPIRGSVCMDVTVVDVGEIETARPGDVATVFGRDGSGEIGLDEIAGWAGTIDYEILTGLGPRLPRIEVGGEGNGAEESDRGTCGE